MATDLEQSRADRALEIEGKVKEGIQAARTVWVALAAFLSEFHEQKLWIDRGHDTFDSWLADPEVDLGRSMAYALIQNYRFFSTYEIYADLDLQDLANYEPTKLQVVIPALKSGAVDIEAALADVETLSRSDLKEKYGKSGGATRKTEKCGICGKQVAA